MKNLVILYCIYMFPFRETPMFQILLVRVLIKEINVITSLIQILSFKTKM
jgi:hypothetical protein